MLAAHLVPGYFAAVASQTLWQANWSNRQRAFLWIAALIATFAPDLDVIYNLLFRGFFGHSTLWTHSIFAHLAILAGWLLLRQYKSLPYLRTLVGLITLGGLSHLALDVISHGTPLFFPLSLKLIGYPSTRVLNGGLWGYLTDPIFLLEPVLLTAATAHWIASRDSEPRIRKFALQGLFTALAVFVGAFLLLLPVLHSIIAI